MNKIRINEVEVDVVYKQKKIKNIIIRISDGIVNLSYPMKCSKENAEDFLSKQKEWIIKHYKPKRKNIFEKEEVRIFDEVYKLNVDFSQKEKIIVKEDVIFVNKEDKNIIFDYFEGLFIKNFEDVREKFNNVLKKEPMISFRFMKTKWGSCNLKNYIININKKLLFVDKEYLNYVLHHEFTHFIVPNHSKLFYKTLKEYYGRSEEMQKKIKKIEMEKHYD